MKTLKFMLAAATAIGLASATQAAQNTAASTGFEKLLQGTAVVTDLSDNDGYSYFYYAGTNALDNESEIVAAPSLTGAQRPTGVTRFTGADLTSQANALKVSTGTDPLLRTLLPLENSKPKGQTVTDDIYVDTLVQFTVTPPTDEVKPAPGVDKLMIYLGANTNAQGEVVSKTLRVVGGFLNFDGAIVTEEYDVTNVSVDTNTWYRLTVQTIADVSVDENGGSGADNSFMGFRIWVNGTLCTFDKKTFDDTDDENNGAMDYIDPSIYYDLLNGKQMVLSLLAISSSLDKDKIQGVGFAGEGFVDDLVVTTTDPLNPNIVDFTFDRSGTGVGAVSFTVNGGAAQSLGGTYEVSIGDTIVVTAAAQEGYVLTAPTTNGLTYVSGDYASCTYTVAGAASLTINAEEQQETPLEPGQQDPTTYNSQAAAEAAAAKVVIGVPTAVATAFGDDAAKTAAYKALFEAKVVSDGNGGYKVEVGLTDEAEDDLQDQVDDDAAEVIKDLSESTVTLDTTPGLYYSFEYGTALNGMTEGARALATGDTLTLTRPTTANATAGFYKVLVNITDK